MRVGESLEIDEERLADLCRRYHVAELCLFGSALGADFGTSSDVDVLYVFQPGARIGWREIYNLERELSELFGRSVDLVPKQWLNPSISERVLAQARTIYAA